MALLDAAEAAFAVDGVDAVSLRSIMREAGANAAAVHYHYGSRDALAGAVLDRVLAPLQERRIELLDDLVIQGQVPSVAALIEALVRPDLEAVVSLGERNPGGGRLIGMIYARPSIFVKTLVEGHFGPVATRFMPHFEAALPHLESDEIAWRVRWCVFGPLGALLSDEALSIIPESLDIQLARFVVAAGGALLAPHPLEFTP